MVCDNCGSPSTVTWEIDGKVMHLCMDCYKIESKKYTQRRVEESWMSIQKNL